MTAKAVPFGKPSMSREEFRGRLWASILGTSYSGPAPVETDLCQGCRGGGCAQLDCSRNAAELAVENGSVSQAKIVPLAPKRKGQA